MDPSLLLYQEERFPINSVSAIALTEWLNSNSILSFLHSSSGILTPLKAFAFPSSTLGLSHSMKYPSSNNNSNNHICEREIVYLIFIFSLLLASSIPFTPGCFLLQMIFISGHPHLLLPVNKNRIALKILMWEWWCGGEWVVRSTMCIVEG